MIKPPFDIDDHGKRVVRRAVAKPGELCDAVMDFTMGNKVDWTLREIEALNRELDECAMTIDQLREARK